MEERLSAGLVHGPHLLWVPPRGVVRTSIDPDADIHGSKEYRTHLAGVLTERAIRLAQERALAAEPHLRHRH